MIGKENQYFMTVQELRRIVYRNHIHTMIFAARPDEGQEERTYVKVVRCEDCIAYIPFKDEKGGICTMHREYEHTFPDDYCSRGERKEDAEIH